MKNGDVSPPLRLADLPLSEGGELGGLMRQATVADATLSPAARRRVRRALRAGLLSAAHPQRRRVARLALAASMAALLVGGGIVGAAIPITVARWLAERRGPASPPTVVADAPVRRARPRRQVAVAEKDLGAGAPPDESPAVPEQSPPPEAPAAAAPTRVAPKASPPPAPRPSPPATTTRSVSAADSAEAGLLSSAMRSLRVRGDAGAALALLDERAAHFPAGSFSAEATALRVEALLALKRSHDALSELDRLSPEELPRGDEWTIVRAELRAGASRWSEAETDFNAAWKGLEGRGAGNGRLAERALWGRATARAWKGDRSAARLDWETYLHRFPRGRFAAEAMRLLGSTAPR